MAITTSDFQSHDTVNTTSRSDDPKFIIHRMILSDEFNHTPAEHAIMAWLISLPSELDPALAAKRLVNKYADDEACFRDDAVKTLNFLRQTAEFPHARLSLCRSNHRKRRRYNA
ncbi:hypothetical protein O4H49_08875 [Kiloniella laminariae]|uniref:Uncharacterized protein n=1 Tax=Kiloniella laminariae TaxID=454162 RepID=A0ABT4LIF9_9PROT|nr:hypothetical protein [Kiloniella laminariae]MCZ4280886.1 hypothetical protein [Kiloniella laminariae]